MAGCVCVLRVTYFSRVLRIGYFCCTEKGQFDLSRGCGHGPSPITHSSGFFFLPLKCSFIYSQGCFHIERRASREIYIHITMTCQTQRSRGRMNVMARERWLYNGYFSGSSWFDVKVSLALYFPDLDLFNEDFDSVIYFVFLHNIFHVLVLTDVKVYGC